VLPVSDKFNDYAMKVHAALKGAEFRGRAAVDLSNERVNAKIKVAQDDKVPYMLVVGGRDQEAGTVSVRDRARGDLGAMPLATFLERAGREIASHGVEIVKV